MDRVIGTRGGTSQLRRVCLQAHTLGLGRRAVPAGASVAQAHPDGAAASVPDRPRQERPVTASLTCARRRVLWACRGAAARPASR